MSCREFLFCFVLSMAAFYIVTTFDWSGWLLKMRKQSTVLSCENPDYVGMKYFSVAGERIHTEYTYRCADGMYLHSPTMLTTRSESQ